MTDSHTFDEQHYCIICDAAYHVQVTYDLQGHVTACIPVSEGVRVLPLPDQPLPVIVCTHHAGIEVARTLAERFSEAHDHDHEHDAET